MNSLDDDPKVAAVLARLHTEAEAQTPELREKAGKSLHGWFRVQHLGRRDQVRFFWMACLLGADPTRWDLCGWLRMPGGLRMVDGVPSVRQRILYFNTEACRA